MSVEPSMTQQGWFHYLPPPECKTDYESGMSVQKVAHKYGVARETMRRALHHYGTQMRYSTHPSGTAITRVMNTSLYSFDRETQPHFTEIADARFARSEEDLRRGGSAFST